MKAQPPHTPEDEARGEKWKTRPSTETTSDEGENARREREHRAEENGAERPVEGPAPRGDRR